jgi:hypothetical protein
MERINENKRNNMKKIYICGKITNMAWGSARAKMDYLLPHFRLYFPIFGKIIFCLCEIIYSQFDF